MKNAITTFSHVLALSTLSVALPHPVSLPGLIGHELPSGDPLSDLIKVQSPTRSLTYKPLPTMLSAPFTPKDESGGTSMCMHTHTVGSGLVTHTRPCLSARMSIPAVATAEFGDTPMCPHTHIMDGQLMTYTIPCTATGMPMAAVATGESENTSRCFHTHTIGSEVVTHTRPCPSAGIHQTGPEVITMPMGSSTMLITVGASPTASHASVTPIVQAADTGLRARASAPVSEHITKGAKATGLASN